MSKLILKDKTEIMIEAGSSLGDIIVKSASTTAMAETWVKMTVDNLSEVEITNDSDVVSGAYTDLKLESETSVIESDGTVTTHYRLREKTDLERAQERIAELEKQMSIHDSAISDLGEVTSTMASQIGG